MARSFGKDHSNRISQASGRNSGGVVASRITRRSLLKAGVASALIPSVLAPIVSRAASAQPAQKVTLKIGRFPDDIIDTLMPIVMEQRKLLETAGAALGYDLTVEWSDYSSGKAVAEGLLSGTLQIGPMGMTPLLNLYNNAQPIVPFAVGTGRFKFPLVVRKGSPIRQMDDLKGKTVGLILGTDLQFVLADILMATYGTGDAQSLGIKLVNVAVPAQLATVPQGVDAAVAEQTGFLKAQTEVGTEAITSSYGYTESYYKGPLGEGAGHMLPMAKTMPDWPEGVFGHRVLWVANENFVRQNPKIIAAFIVASQQALKHLISLGSQGAAALGEKDWGLPAARAKGMVEDDTLWGRGWCFITEGDARMFFNKAQAVVNNKVITPHVPFTWAGIKRLYDRAAEPGKLAYKALGNSPSESEFLDTSKDKRGLPNWESARWQS